MRAIFAIVLKKLTKDRSHMYRNFFKAAFVAKSELLMIGGIVSFELVEYLIREKRSEISEKLMQIKILEKDLQEKKISLD